MTALIFGILALCALACLACIWFGHGLDTTQQNERKQWDDCA
jgi:hypothetical protein